jgi:hypothetical protein
MMSASTDGTALSDVYSHKGVQANPFVFNALRGIRTPDTQFRRLVLFR